MAENERLTVDRKVKVVLFCAVCSLNPELISIYASFGTGVFLSRAILGSTSQSAYLAAHRYTLQLPVHTLQT
jgi:hypothetical protein